MVAGELLPVNRTLSDSAAHFGSVSQYLWVLSLISHSLSFPTFPILLAPSRHHYMQSYEAVGGLEDASQEALEALHLQSPSFVHLVQLHSARPLKRECFRQRSFLDF